MMSGRPSERREALAPFIAHPPRAHSRLVAPTRARAPCTQLSPRQPGVSHEPVFRGGIEVLVHVEVRVPHVGLALVEPSALATPRSYNFVDASSTSFLHSLAGGLPPGP